MHTHKALCCLLREWSNWWQNCYDILCNVAVFIKAQFLGMVLAGDLLVVPSLCSRLHYLIRY